MKYIFILSLCAALVVACGKAYDKKPANSLTTQQQKAFIDSTIRYMAKPPANATHETKFDTAYNRYYQIIVEDYDVRAYEHGADGTDNFLVTRKARSITPMRESIGGKVKFGQQGEVVYYEEVFRTWKMPEEIMEQRYPVLFNKMVAGKSLEEYYPKTAGDKFIEFPDGRFYFDVKQRKWRDQVMDSLQVQ
jgi:hypothetical protein